VNLKLSSQLRAGYLGVDIRRDAVTEDVPSRGIFPGEGEAFLSRETAPDPLRVGAQFVHDNRRVSVPLIQYRAMLLNEVRVASPGRDPPGPRPAEGNLDIRCPERVNEGTNRGGKWHGCCPSSPAHVAR
jgi:hypothetical protein